MTQVIKYTNRVFGTIYIFTLTLGVVFPNASLLYYTEFIHVAWMLLRPYEFEIILLFLLASLIVNWVASINNTSRWVDVIISIIMVVHFMIDGVEYLETLKKYIQRFPDKKVPLDQLTKYESLRIYLLIFLDVVGTPIQPLMLLFAVLVVLNEKNSILGLVEFLTLVISLVFSFMETKYLEAAVIIVLILLTIQLFQRTVKPTRSA